MGKAAYDRGTEAIRQQIDRELESRPKRHPAEISLYHAERVNRNLRGGIETLTAELEKAMRYLALARLERDAALEAAQRATERASRWKDTATRFKRSWDKASRLLRLFPANEVAEKRELNSLYE